MSTSCEGCPLADSCSVEEQSTCTIQNNPNNAIKNVIGVMSGKGGVGKSTVSVLLAQELNKQGYSVGIMDADITGPSIPRLLNINERKATSNELGIIPITTPNGIEVISLNFLVEDENQPVIWRGPLVSNVVQQFWTEVLWGELDYLIIDLPPGTGDVALTAMQSIPMTGVVVVSVPQDLVSMVVSKSINMAKQMDIPILGVVENMSYVLCPDCNKKIRIFESDNIDEFFRTNQLELLGEFPMGKDIANVAKYGNASLTEDVKTTLEQISKKVIEKAK